MPFVRCRFYDDDGTGSCPRLGLCEYVHPSEPGWDTAPRSNNFSNTKMFSNTNTPRLPPPLGRRPREERKFRCRYFGEDGQSINGGCTRTNCTFVHPSDPDWANAIPNKSSSAFGRKSDSFGGGFRQVDSGYGNQNRSGGWGEGGESTSGGGWGDATRGEGGASTSGRASTSSGAWGDADNDSTNVDSGESGWGSIPDGGGWSSLPGAPKTNDTKKPSPTMNHTAMDADGSGWGSTSDARGGGWPSLPADARTDNAMEPTRPAMEDLGWSSSDLGHSEKKTLASGWGAPPSLDTQGSDLSLTTPWRNSAPPKTAGFSGWGDTIMSKSGTLGGWGETALEAPKSISGWESSTTDNRNATADSVAGGYSDKTGLWCSTSSAIMATSENDKRDARSTYRPSLSSRTPSSHDGSVVMDKSQLVPTAWEVSSASMPPSSPSLTNNSSLSGISASLAITKWLTQRPKNAQDKKDFLEAVVETVVHAVDTQMKLAELNEKKEAWKRVMNSAQHSNASRTGRAKLEATRDDLDKEIRHLEKMSSDFIDALAQLPSLNLDMSEKREVDELKVQIQYVKRLLQDVASGHSEPPAVKLQRTSADTDVSLVTRANAVEKRLSELEEKMDDQEKSGVSFNQIWDVVNARLEEKMKALSERGGVNDEAGGDSVEELRTTVDTYNEMLTKRTETLEKIEERLNLNHSELVLMAGDVAALINRDSYWEDQTNKFYLTMTARSEQVWSHQSSERVRKLEVQVQSLRDQVKDTSARLHRRMFDSAELQSRIEAHVAERIETMQEQISQLLQSSLANIRVGIDEQHRSMLGEVRARLPIATNVTDVVCDYFIGLSARQDTENPA